MKFVFIATVTTESCDHYVYAFAKKPTRLDVAELVWQIEGSPEGPSIADYHDSCLIEIEKCEML